MNLQTVLSITAPSIILSIGIFEDLRSRKVRNPVVLGCLALAIVAVLIGSGVSGLLQGLLGFTAAFALFIPLVAFKITGAGDMKLMMAFGMATHWQTVFSVFIFALFWGALLGVVRALLAGHFLQLLRNTFKLGTGTLTTQSSELQMIPYTVALGFGWISHLVYNQGGLM